MTMLPTSRRRSTYAVTGLGLVVAAVLAVVLVFKSFSGDFGDVVRVTASVSQVGDSLQRDDIVTYRDVIIGKVTDFEASAAGGARVTLRIEGSQADRVPSGVTALAVPSSFFGNTKIILVPPDETGGPGLRDGQTVAANTSPSAAGLQTALSQLYTLLTAVSPAELNQALTALASALSGRGEQVGRLIDRTAAFLTTVSPALPDIQRSIRSFAAVTTELARDTPQLLSAVANALTPAAAVVRQQAAIRQLLAVGPAAADRARRLVERIGDDTVTVVTDAQPILAAFDERPDAIGATITGFRDVGTALNTVFRNGRVQVNVLTSGVSASNLVAVVAGQKTHVLDKLADPEGYTAADCPRYPGASGTNCAGAITTRGPAANAALTRALVSSMGGVPASEVSPAAQLLLTPVLHRGSR